jgi:hypothetical protein
MSVQTHGRVGRIQPLGRDIDEYDQDSESRLAGATQIYTTTRSSYGLDMHDEIGWLFIGTYIEFLCQTGRDTTGLEHGLTAVADP